MERLFIYKLLFLDDSGHVVNIQSFACRDDAEARMYAERCRDERGLELWGPNLIVRLSGRGMR
jgi:hypothetical protein